ncbi:MAG: ABC transporter permease [Thermomicrobiales bacterium]|nr:ABC transporter permease [Thermomicrobiales bacterium]MCO5227165.1 ABC transporter permease [Thermomicrobiales bacterium]
MNSFLAMLIANIKMSLRNRQAMFWNLAFPALFIVLFGAIWGNSNFSNFDVGVVQSDSELRTRVVGAFDSSDSFKVHEGTLEEELAALENNDRSVVIAFPTEAGGAITLYSADRPGDVNTEIAISATRSVLMNVLGATMGTPIEEVHVEALNTTFIDWFMPGIIAMSLMNTGIIGISTAFVAFREKGILRRIKVTPFPLWKFLTARVIGAMIVGLLSTFVLIGLSMILFGAEVRGNWLLIIAVIVLVSTCMLSIGAAIAAIARNVETAAGMANMITFPMMFLSGVFFPISSMPDWMRPIMAVMPLKYGVNALREPMLYGHGISAIWTDLLILIAISIAAIFIAVRMFRWESTDK